MPKYDIILTTFGRLEYTQRTFASMIQADMLKGAERIIIVDNNTPEDKAPGMRAFLNDLHDNFGAFIILRPRNDGWGMAVNDALNMSRAPYVLLANNDVEFHADCMQKAFDLMGMQWVNNGQLTKGIGILGFWRHTAHGLQKGGINASGFKEMDNVPAVAWLMPKTAMIEVGLLPEHGPCFTKGGNGEDTGYVMRMKEKGYLVGVPDTDLATHIDGY